MSSLKARSRVGLWVLAFVLLALYPSVMFSQGAAPATPDLSTQVSELSTKLANTKVAMDTVWVLITAFLVFWMNAGFALVESGMCRVKNAVNILSKNFIVFALSSLAFYVLGWGVMFGDGNGFMGLKGLFMLSGADNSPATGSDYMGVYTAINWTGVPLYAKFFLSAGICRYRRHHRIRLRGRAREISQLYSVLAVACRCCLSHHRSLDLGWRLAGTDGFL
jgi:Amt family ammonium transporter